MTRPAPPAPSVSEVETEGASRWRLEAAFAFGALIAAVVIGLWLMNLPPLSRPDQVLGRPPVAHAPLPAPTRDTFTATRPSAHPRATVAAAAPSSTAPSSVRSAGAAKPTRAPRPLPRPVTHTRAPAEPSPAPAPATRAPIPSVPSPAPAASLHCLISVLGVSICVG